MKILIFGCGVIGSVFATKFAKAGYDEWNKKLGDGRLIPAFPGAGGVIVDGILDAGLTPAIIQKTTFGEIGGKRSERIGILESVFIRAKTPCEVCCSMNNSGEMIRRVILIRFFLRRMDSIGKSVFGSVLNVCHRHTAPPCGSRYI